MSRQRGDDELRHAAWHVTRELSLLSQLYRTFLGPAPKEVARNELERSAVVECALVHLRCLAEFLVGRPSRGKGSVDGRRWRSEIDITPEHFTPGWPSRMSRSEHAGPVMKSIEFCDRRLAHLSWDRLEDGDFYSPVVVDCAELFMDFVGHVHLHRPEYTVLSLSEASASLALCGSPVRFPEWLWFHLPDDRLVDKTEDRNGAESLRRYALSLSTRLRDDSPSLREASGLDQPAAYVPAIERALAGLIAEQGVPTTEAEVAAEVLGSIRRARSDAGSIELRH